MQRNIQRSAAALFTAVLALSVLTAITPASAESAGCVATELPLPAGTPKSWDSHLSASDPTGRYQVGSSSYVDAEGELDYHAVLWTGGKPKVFDPPPGGFTSLTDVNSKGTVLGQTSDSAGRSRPWLYSRGTVRKLELPAHLKQVTVLALNARGDVLGYGEDAAGQSKPVIWPAGGKPQRLRADAGSFAVDINDAGIVIGHDDTTGLLWKRWDAKPERVTSPNGTNVKLTQIRGEWFVGIQTSLLNGNLISGEWNLPNTKFSTYPAPPLSVNSSGDVAYFDAGKTLVRRWNDPEYVIDAPGSNMVEYLFDEGQAYDAAGNLSGTSERAVLWSGCSD